MEREIKFRAWDKENKNMYGPFSIYGLCEALKELGDIEIMQFTGLKDKNGVEIYEGDVLRRGDHGLRVVEWENAAFVLRRVPPTDGQKYRVHSFVGKDGCEVIGNIYEHPELCKSNPPKETDITQ